jgi:sulfide:quinone oxidoreductase
LSDEPAAAVKNLLAEITGTPGRYTFRHELICVVDALDTGTLVDRDERRGFSVGGPPLHGAKAAFEWQYLRPYRKAS